MKEFRSDYVKSILNKNPELISPHYAESIRMIPELQKTIVRKNNVVLYHKAFFDRFDIQEYGREEIEILDLGSNVLELGLFTMKLTLKKYG